jgi:hypothetical protein
MNALGMHGYCVYTTVILTSMHGYGVFPNVITKLLRVHRHVAAPVCVCVCVCLCEWVSVCVCVCVCVCMFLCVYEWMYACIYINTWDTYMHAHACMHKCILTEPPHSLLSFRMLRNHGTVILIHVRVCAGGQTLLVADPRTGIEHVYKHACAS